MTDAERNAVFAEKKAETIKKLLGENLDLPVPEDISFKEIDKNWGTHRSWLDNHRPDKKNMNAQQTYEHAYALMERDSGGYVVTVVQEPIPEDKPKDKDKKLA